MSWVWLLILLREGCVVGVASHLVRIRMCGGCGFSFGCEKGGLTGKGCDL